MDQPLVLDPALTGTSSVSTAGEEPFKRAKSNATITDETANFNLTTTSSLLLQKIPNSTSSCRRRIVTTPLHTANNNLRSAGPHRAWSDMKSHGSSHSEGSSSAESSGPSSPASGSSTAIHSPSHSPRASSHSYYDCCINVHVTSLLDHWLDWEPPTTSKTHQTPPTSAPLPEANRTTVDQYCKNHKDHCYLQSSQQHSSRRNFHGGLVTHPSEESEGTLSSSSSSASSSSSEDEGEDEDDEAVIPGRRRDSHFWQPSDAELESPELPDSRFDLTSLLSRLRTARDPLEMLRTDHCDTSVTRLRDENGNTLLHHVLSGHSPFQSQSSLLGFGAYLLTDLSADPNQANFLSETPVLSIRHLLTQSRWEDALAAAHLLVTTSSSKSSNPTTSPPTVDLNARDNLTDQSLLSFSVIHGDQTVDLTRFLINSGATVFNKYPQNNSTPHSTTTARELRDGSAFRSWLKALSTGLLSLEDSRETLEVLCSAMSCEDVSNGPRISRHVDRCMIELGVAPKVNGPLFLKVRSLVAPHSARPQSLMSLSRKNIRRALSGSQRTPVVVKRLGAGQPLSATANRSLHLKLPQKLRKFITMGE